MRDRFAAEYPRDFNATQAAIRAGYSRRTAASQGQRLLKSAAVGKALRQFRKELLKNAEAPVEKILSELAAIAFADPGDLFDKNGRLLPIDAIPEEARRAMRLEVKNRFDAKRKKLIGRRYKINLSAKLPALQYLRKYLGQHLQMSEIARQHRRTRSPAEPPRPDSEGAGSYSGTVGEGRGNLAATKPPSRVGQKGRGSFLGERFAVEYLKDFNATQAAIRAGYSLRTAASQGQRLLSSPAVAQHLRKALGKLLKKYDISVERWLAEVTAIAFGNLFDWVDEHYRLRRINKIPEESRRAISRLEFVESFASKNGQMRCIQPRKLVTSHKLAALRILWEHLEETGMAKMPP